MKYFMKHNQYEILYFSFLNQSHPMFTDNQIGDEGCKAIAEALKVNRTLTSLNLIGDK
jgi:hypothetical protein